MTEHKKRKLHASSSGVVSHLPGRTRLRVPNEHRKTKGLHSLDQALTAVHGVKSVEINHATGSILVHHEDHPDLLDRISHVLEESTPDILLAMLEPEIAVPKIFSSVVETLLEGRKAGDDPLIQNISPNGSYLSKPIKEYVPLAFLGLGIYAMIEEASIIGATAPLALFYYAFDFHWKLRQEKISQASL
jgi:copper chaperone CopZ